MAINGSHQFLCPDLGERSTITHRNEKSLIEDAESESTTPAAHHDQSKPQGVESVLEWDLLASYRTPICLFSDDTVASTQNQSLPSIDYQELSRLASKYIVGVHLKNPILDLAELHRLISYVAENGLDWSARTCLVSLVCAIGAVTQEYQYHGRSPVDNPTPGACHGIGSEPELSWQFWNLAVKRLGFVIGEHDPIAIQCLCLAGYVPHMGDFHRRAPLI